MRWEGDERGGGLADAAGFAPAVDALARTMHDAQWVAEDPESHLLPHIEAACGRLPFRIAESGAAPDGAFDVVLDWSGTSRRVGEVRAAVFALVGSIAELSTFVRQVPDPAPGELRFDVVTGFVGEDGRFAPHGHTLRLAVRGV